jgi:hypothetical protein
MSGLHYEITQLQPTFTPGRGLGGFLTAWACGSSDPSLPFRRWLAPDKVLPLTELGEADLDLAPEPGLLDAATTGSKSPSSESERFRALASGVVA